VGTSLLLAIPLALFGRNIVAMKVTMDIAFAVAAAAGSPSPGPTAHVGRSVRRRLLRVVAALVSWTSLIASDIPYLPLSAWRWRSWLAVRSASRPTGTGTLSSARSLRSRSPSGRRAWPSCSRGRRGRGGAHRPHRPAQPSTRRAVARSAGATVASFVAIVAIAHAVLPYQLLPAYAGSGLAGCGPTSRSSRARQRATSVSTTWSRVASRPPTACCSVGCSWPGGLDDRHRCGRHDSPPRSARRRAAGGGRGPPCLRTDLSLPRWSLLFVAVAFPGWRSPGRRRIGVALAPRFTDSWAAARTRPPRSLSLP